MDYLKYYFLENYLFGEVRNNFQKRGYLLPEEFFCIIIWKANRAKTKIKNRLLKRSHNLREAVKKLTNEIFRASDKNKKLEILLDKWGFQLPMATAILTVLYPEKFTIYDVRVREQLGIKDYLGRKNQINKYISEYLPKVKDFSKKKGLNIRDGDRYLWDKSFYKDLKNFVK
jgi:hypothetical protein